jgi:hypothetical protein
VSATIEEARVRLYAVCQAARNAGYQLLPDGTELFARAPELAPEAWKHIWFPPLEEGEIETLEAELNRDLPLAYREWLLGANGLSMFNDGLAIYGLRTDYSRRPDVRQPFHVKDLEVSARPGDASPDLFFLGAADEAREETSWEGSNLYVDGMGRAHLSRRRDVEPLESWDDLPTALVDLCRRLERRDG